VRRVNVPRHGNISDRLRSRPGPSEAPPEDRRFFMDARHNGLAWRGVFPAPRRQPAGHGRRGAKDSAHPPCRWRGTRFLVQLQRGRFPCAASSSSCDYHQLIESELIRRNHSRASYTSNGHLFSSANGMNGVEAAQPRSLFGKGCEPALRVAEEPMPRRPAEGSRAPTPRDPLRPRALKRPATGVWGSMAGERLPHGREPGEACHRETPLASPRTSGPARKYEGTASPRL